MTIEAMKQAFDKACEAMEAAGKRIDELKAENASLRQAIAEAEKQEPVGYWMGEFSKDGGATLYEVPQESAFGRKYRNIPLYTSPPQRQWVGLTDKELREIIYETGFGLLMNVWFDGHDGNPRKVLQAIEAKLKQKNGYE